MEKRIKNVAKKTENVKLTLITRVTAKACIALTMTADAVSVSVAAVRTISHHLAGYRCIERHLLVVPVVVVQRDEPKARLHEPSDVAMNCGLVSGARRSRVESA